MRAYLTDNVLILSIVLHSFFRNHILGTFFSCLNLMVLKEGSSSFKGRFKPKYSKAIGLIGKLDVVRMACFMLLRVYRSFWLAYVLQCSTIHNQSSTMSSGSAFL